ncbi:hypothetical protein [Bacillus salipaludis]|uniref:phage baseplate protein n=1 Tax=Bacillus salipaludis TaxID=2547811 RepID=UPI002E21F81D|nr:hypothetical protein [Bacillus salipaludis]
MLQQINKIKGKNKIIFLLVFLILFFFIAVLIRKNPESKRFQFENIKPVYYESMNTADTTVMQSFAVDEIHKQIFVSQVKSGHTGNVAESYIITRCSMDGQMLDSMTLTFGGHGTSIGVEINKNKIYIWSSFDKVNINGVTTGHDLVRFQYKADENLTPFSPNLQNYSDLINPSSSMLITPTIDNKNRKLAVSQRDRYKHKQWVDIYNIDDILKHKPRKTNKIDIPESLLLLQGLSLDGNYLYWRTGDENEINYKDLVTVFDINTGRIIVQRRVALGWDISPYETIYREPEGIYMYTNSDTGKKMLFVGVVTGVRGKDNYRNRIYVYQSPK